MTNAGVDLDTLKQTIRITDLARELGLQVRGKQARCYNTTSHKNGDRTPSLSFDTKTNRYKCFACGVQGSVIDLYKEVKGVSVAEAINELKALAGLTGGKGVKRGKVATRPHSTPQTLAQPITGEITAIYEALGTYCISSLNATDRQAYIALDKESYDYLTGDKRGLTPATLKRFKLFSITDYKATSDYLKKNYSPEALQQAGLVSDKGNLIFFKHKIIIPFVKHGRIIFLQGRRIDQEHPRYMHLKRPVPLFNEETIATLKKGESVYICEGVFDAMMLEQNGYHAVAILGVNNFKREMAELFRGLDVVLALDNDEDGIEATKQIAGIFSLQGQSVRTKQLPDGVKDITEYFIK